MKNRVKSWVYIAIVYYVYIWYDGSNIRCIVLLGMKCRIAYACNGVTKRTSAGFTANFQSQRERLTGFIIAIWNVYLINNWKGWKPFRRHNEPVKLFDLFLLHLIKHEHDILQYIYIYIQIKFLILKLIIKLVETKVIE